MTPSQVITFHGLGIRMVWRRDGSSTIETVDLQALRRELGDDLLGAFLRLFVWADRLQSLAHFALWNDQGLSKDSVPFNRNLHTFLWFAGSALFEAADAVDQLKKAGIEARAPDSEKWHALHEMADRWTKEKRLRRLRNNVGFHVDPEVMARGIEDACGNDERLIIFAGQDDTAGGQSLRLGLEVLLRGMRMEVAQFRDLFEVVGEDFKAFSGLVQEVFIETLQRCGALRG